MRHSVGALGLLCVLCGSVCAQAPATVAKAASEAPPVAKAAKVRVATYIHLDRLPLGTMIPAPPTAGSPEAKAEFAELHRIEAARTPEQIKAAQADDAEEDIFVYRSVLGPGFSAEALPLTAAFGTHVHGDEPVASNALKERFARPRPYQVDKTLHPVCKLTDQHNAYPSGHTVSGYLLALSLAEMVPEKSGEILARADQYAHNRLVCGVHTASDLEASRRIAYAVFAQMLDDPRFQKDIQAARQETRAALHMNQ